MGIAFTERRMRQLLDLVSSDRVGDPDSLIPQSFLDDALRILDSDLATYEVLDPYERRCELQDSGPVDDEEIDGLEALWWSAFWESCSYAQKTGDYSAILRSDDRIPGNVRGPKWNQYFENFSWQPRHYVYMSLAPMGTVDRRFLLWRDGSTPFTDDEVATLGLLRPHIERLLEAHSAASQSRPQLTARQWEVLHLLASGRTNRQIARAMAVSEGTIRKHVENIFDRLGVANRAEAVAVAARVTTINQSAG